MPQKNVPISIDYDLWNRVKMALKQGETFSGVVEEALRKWEKKRKS